VRDQFSHP